MSRSHAELSNILDNKLDALVGELRVSWHDGDMATVSDKLEEIADTLLPVLDYAVESLPMEDDDDEELMFDDEGDGETVI